MAFANKARDIVVQCMAVQKAIGEDVASSDFQLICPSANATFNAAGMQNMDDRSREKQPRDYNGLPVLCTTEIGLCRREKMEIEGSKVGRIQAITVIKAKVVLQKRQ